MANDAHHGCDDGVQERLRLGLDGSATLLCLQTAGRQLVEVVGRVQERSIPNSVKSIEGGDDEGDESESLLGRKVSKRTR